MRVKDYGRFNRLFAVMAAVALVLASIGMVKLVSTPYTGFSTTADFRAIDVDPLGPAAKAGMKAGDVIAGINGIPIENLREVMRQRRLAIGDALGVSVLRERVRYELQVLQTALPFKSAFLAWAGNLVALGMLALGLVLYWLRPNKASSLFFLANLSFSLALATPPYFHSLAMRTIISVNAVFFLTMGLAFLLHLSIIFPQPKPLIRETNAVEYLIYLPAPLMAISYLALRVFQPKADLLVNVVLHDIFALLVLACVGMALAAVLHSFWKSGEQRKTFGMQVMILGVLIGSILPASKLFVETFLPDMSLPGRAFFPLASILISIGFGLALWNAAGAGEGRPHFHPLVFRRASGQ